ncbi:MAG: SHOCT domain-containing protein [Actinomycetota bacterium]
MMWGWDSGWGWGMGIGMLVFWGLIVLAIWAVARAPHEHAAREDRASPDQILAERFARGEISADEYQERRQVLSKR